jgi:hypothetical protein
VRCSISKDAATRQGIFVAEWLFFEHSADAAADRAGYDRIEFPVRYVNIRVDRLNRLEKDEPVCRYQSHDFDVAVLDYLARHWPLDNSKPPKRRSGSFMHAPAASHPPR